MKNPSLSAVAGRFCKCAAWLMLGVAVLPQSALSVDYATAVLSDNPVAFWQLNETGDPSSGTLTAADSSGHALNGTYGVTSQNKFNGILSPQPPTFPGFASGQGALLCSDVTSAVALPALNLTTNVVDTTIIMWINPALQPPTAGGLLFDRSGGAATVGFGFSGTQSGGLTSLGYNWNDSSATWNWNSGLFPPLNTWSFVGLVIQTNRATAYLYYIDPNTSQPVLASAVNVATHAGASWSGAGPRVLGNDTFNTTRVFPGSISGAAIFNTALTADQMLTLFAAGLGVNGFAPSITAQPQSRYIVSGSSARLRATVSGSSPLSYQWQLNGTNVNLLPNSANYTGANSNVLTILSATTTEAGSYHLIITNVYGSVTSSNAIITIQSPALVGQWFTNNSLAEVSGFMPTGTHDGFAIGGLTYGFTNDVPNGKSGQSLLLSDGISGIAISNSSTLDITGTNTFDERINNAFTVALWAKGWPGTWNPFASKYGEAGLGWQLRQFGQDGVNPCWTLRGVGGTVTLGIAGSFSGPDDLGSTGFPLGNDTNNWHFYVGTYDASTGVRNLYVDGQLAAQATNSAVYTLSPASYLCFGARDNGGASFANFFVGEIYDARIYNFAIPSSTVLQLYGVNPPSISVQPATVSVFAGEPTKLNTTVGGTPPLSYQWKLNGTNVNLLPNSANYTGANSNVLTIISTSAAEVGSYQLTVTNLYGTAISSNAIVSLAQTNLVGRWVGGAASLADISGYRAPGTHDGYAVGNGIYVFTNDVPAGFAGQSLYFPGADSAIAIANSANTDGAYTNTFDDPIRTHITVTCWAKGTRDQWSWNPWVSKYGEGANGWQLRTGGAGVLDPCWTVRDGGSGTYTLGCGPGWSPGGDLDDLHAAFSGAGAAADGNRVSIDNNWHFLAGTYNSVTGIRNLYVDGELRGQETGNTLYNLAPNAPVCIGARFNPSTAVFEGFSIQEIFDVRIYNYDLNSNAIAALMPDPVISVEPPPAINAYVGGVTKIIASGIGRTAPITNQWQLNGVNLTNGPYNGAFISGANSSTLTLTHVTTDLQGVYRLVVSNSKGTFIGSNTTVTVLNPVAPPAGAVVGSWFTGPANLTDTSGYSPAGTHDGWGVAGLSVPSSSYGFTNDVPAGKTGRSLLLSGSAAIAISNSLSTEVAYTNTFDDTITNMTVMLWAKGWPGAWNPFISKYGENGLGWQLRRNGGSSPCWTVRGMGGVEDMSGSDTMSNDGLWHHYTGTFTFDGTTSTDSLYVDGVLKATQSGSLPYTLSPGAYLAIGGRYDPSTGTFGNYFAGEIYGVRIFNTALSEAQINSFLTVPPPQPGFSTSPVLSGFNLILSWTNGSLLQATNLPGPWTPAGGTSPYTNDVRTAPRMFYKVTYP